jgi:hypothetical protein
VQSQGWHSLFCLPERHNKSPQPAGLGDRAWMARIGGHDLCKRGRLRKVDFQAKEALGAELAVQWLHCV